MSGRRAFAQAFALALRHDRVHSLLVPVMLRAPWLLAVALLPPITSGAAFGLLAAISSLALLGDVITALVIGAMLRLRAESARARGGGPPAPALDCYAHGLRRVPALLATELGRNLTLAFAASLTLIPAALIRLRPLAGPEDVPRAVLLLGVLVLLALPPLYLSYRLAVATEAAVLDRRGLPGAFRCSFQLTKGHAGRWLEMVLASGLLVLGMAMLVSLIAWLVPGVSGAPVVTLFGLSIAALWPVILYAWTFFFIQLREARAGALEPGALSPRGLRLVPGEGPSTDPSIDLPASG